MKGQEDRFSFSLGPVQGGGELRFPANFFSHGAFSFSPNAALDLKGTLYKTSTLNQL